MPLTSNFTRPDLLLGLLILLPLILLYFLKPKPRYIKLPTTMFVMKMERMKLRSFFNRFVRDPLLISQILIISVLVLALAGPFFISHGQKSTDEVVFVIDASASMQATDVSPSRFSAAVQKANEILGGCSEDSKISIILAENIHQVIVLDHGTPAQAQAVLNTIECSDTPSNIGDALLLAKDLVVEETPKIYVLSDFASQEGTDVLAAKRLASSKAEVSLIKISKGGDNTGITDFKAYRTTKSRDNVYLAFTVKNFGVEKRNADVNVMFDNVLISSENETIKPGSEEMFYLNGSVSRDEHVISITLKPEDDMDADNKVSVYVPPIRQHKVLLLTSGQKDSYLRYALEALSDSGIDLTVAPPPVECGANRVFCDLSAYEAIILGTVLESKTEFFVPGDFDQINGFVNKGGNLIVMASPSVKRQTETIKDMLPVELGEVIHKDDYIEKEFDHEVLKDVRFENSVVKIYLEAQPANGSTTLLSANGTPMLSFWNKGGKVAYMGVNPDPEWSNIYISSSFPILWLQLIEWMGKSETETTGNLPAGTYYYTPPGFNISTPSGATTDKNLILDKIGLYRVGSEKIFVNLVNEKESNITSIAMDGTEISGGKKAVDVKEQLYKYLLAAAVLLLLVEMVLYRRRGLI